MTLAWIALGTAPLLGLYAYAGYPLLLKLVALLRRHQEGPEYGGDDWPTISLSVPAYNEEHQIAETVESLLALDYPADRRQILIVSDGSTDRTDEIVGAYEDRGVELARVPVRGGKTAAENLAARHLRGEIIVNTDASIRIHPNALKPLIAPFKDPSVGLASGRDLSVGKNPDESNQGEAGYVGYEMWVRSLETAVAGIVGASGCYYAIRPELQRISLPGALSRDFAAALNTRARGFRAVSVPEATCAVPRTASLRAEYPRKVRTMVRGMQTLLFKRALMNPFRQGLFAWMLFSHKVCRWLLPWAALVSLAGLVGLAPAHLWARWGLVAAAVAIGVSSISWAFVDLKRLPGALTLPAFALMGNFAALKASILALSGANEAIWEPTRREPATTPITSSGPPDRG